VLGPPLGITLEQHFVGGVQIRHFAVDAHCFSCSAFIRQNPVLAQYTVDQGRFAGLPKADRASGMQPSVDQLLEQLESRIGDRVFLAGRNPTIADCTLFALMEAAYFSFKYELPANYPRLRAWYKRFSERPSARIS
jgi:glutathione S-transferase